MKNLILTLALTAFASTTFAQGWVLIINGPGTLVYTNQSSCAGGSARGLTPGSGMFIYRLFIAPAGTTDPEVFQDTGVGAGDVGSGGVYGQNQQVQGWPAGVTKCYLIRGWSINLGYDWSVVNAYRQAGWAGAPANSFYGESEIGSGAADANSFPGFPLFSAPTGITNGFDLFACCFPPLAPSNLTGPTNTSVRPGGTATFTVSASGGFLRYLWYKNTTPLADGSTGYGSTYGGVRTPTLRISNVAAADAVASASGFSCRVTNYSGAPFSVRAGLIVDPPSSNLLVYTDQLQNGFVDQSVGCSHAWNFTDTHSGIYSALFIPNSQYGGLWFYHTDLDTSGYTNLSFWVKGEEFTSPELQVVARLGAFWQTPRPLDLLLDNTWQKVTFSLSDLGVANQTNFVGFMIRDAGEAVDMAYIVDDVQLESRYPDGRPVIAGHPTNQNATAGATVSFNVLASGADPLSYQWRFNGGSISAATGARLTIANAQPESSGGYSVVVTNTSGSVTSRVATLTVPGPPTIVVNDGSLGFVTNHFCFNITGTTGQVIVVEGSNDFSAWNPIRTNTFGSSPFYFCDPQAATTLTRYYRVRTQ